MSLYRNAFYWFCALLGLSVLGFWRSYFSNPGGDSLHITHHVHGIAMLLWVGMLIVQSWLIRTRRNPMHRTLGRVSFGLAPVVFVSAVWVNLHFMEGREGPFAADLISAFSYQLFLPVAFAALYVMAIVHRRRMQLHARYMAATALVFIHPGLQRASDNYLEPLVGWGPTFFQLALVPLVIGVWLLFLDWRGKKPLEPFAVFSGLWVANVLVWILTPRLQVWQTVAEWAAVATR